MKLFANTASRHNQVYVCYYSGTFLFKSLRIVCRILFFFFQKLEEIKKNTLIFLMLGVEIN